MKRIALIAALAATSAGAQGPDEFSQFALRCEFPDIPPVVFSYSRRGTDLVGVMTAGGRGPVLMSLGSGSARFESATVDGLRFRWSPQNAWMDVERDGELVRSSQGSCQPVAFGSTGDPLNIN